jgi:hypothetical protein
MADRTAHDALSDAYNDVAPELAYIKKLADVVALAPERGADGDTIEALALSIKHMADALEGKLEAALEASRG